MASIPVSDHGDNGSAVTFQDAAAGGDVIPVVDGTTVLRIRNASGSNAYTVTIAARACSHGFVHNLVLSIPAGANLVYNTPLLSPDRFDPLAAVTYSGSAVATDLDVAVVRMTNLQGVA